MSSRRFSEEEKQFMRDNCTTMIISDMERHMGWSSSAILKFLRGEGIEQSKELKSKLLREKLVKNSTVTPEQDRIIREEYLITPVKTLAEKIGRSHTLVETRLKQLGLVIPREIIEQRKIDSRRKPGDAPPNKGLKQSEYMSPEQIEKTKATRFQKGQVPPNTIGVIGTITVRQHQKKHGVLLSKWILVAEKTWKELKHYNWERVHGPIPKGMRLRFIDGDPMNCEIENLELITIQENMKRNSIHNLPEDLRYIVQLKGAVNRQINKRSKKNKP